MVQHGVAVVQDAIAASTKPNAQGGIVETDYERTVEAADRVERLSPKHQAGRGHRRKLSRDIERAVVPGGAAAAVATERRDVLERMVRGPVEPDDHAAVLHAVVTTGLVAPVQKERTYRADVTPGGQAAQTLEPARRDRLDVVVHEEHVRAASPERSHGRV